MDNGLSRWIECQKQPRRPGRGVEALTFSHVLGGNAMAVDAAAKPAAPSPPTRVQVGDTILGALRAGGTDCIVSVPDFNFVDLLAQIDADPSFKHIPVSREEEGIGVCVGAYLGGLQPVMVMQNAGLLNSCNALTTTALQFEIPILMIIWYAGDFGDTAFMRLGEVTEGVLEGLGIRYLVPRSFEELGPSVERAKKLADYAKRPVAVLVTRY
jgi:sulfopyruvate decarboxylase subunit alpha